MNKQLPGLFKALGLSLMLALAFTSFSWAASPEEYLSNARGFIDKGELRAAVIELKNALRADPALVEGRLLLGELYVRMGDGAGAEKELRRAAKLGASEERWINTLADAYLLQRKYQEVLDEVQLDSSQSVDMQVEALVQRGKAYLALEQFDQAEQVFNHALTLQADSASALLGSARLAMARKELLSALRLVNNLLSKSPNNLGALLLQAELNRQTGEYQTALNSFNRLLELNPENQRARLGRSATLVALGKSEQALSDLDAIEGDNKIPMVQYLRAVVDFQKQDMKSAKQHLELVLRSAPDHTQSLLLYGVANYALGQMETADQYLSRAVKALPNNIQAIKLQAATKMKLKKPKQAISLLEPLALNSDDAQLLALLGSAYMMEGNHSKGSELLSQAVAKAPDMAALRAQLALGLLAEGETEQAITELQSAVDMGQDLLQADILLILTQLREKHYEEALKVGQALEKRMPDSALPHNLAGLTFFAKGDLDKADQKFRKALAIDPNFTTAKMNLARVAMARNDLSGAEQQYREILKQSADDMGALLGLAELARARGDREAYHELLNQAYTVNPNALKPGLLLSEYYRNIGDPLKALRVANEMSGRFPENLLVLQHLAMAQLAAGEANSAVRSFNTLIAKQGTSERLLSLLATAQAAAGDFLGARDSYKQAISLAPDNNRLKLALGSMEFQNKRYDRALQVAREVQKIDPKSAAAFHLEASALAVEDQSVAAIRAYEKAYSLQPTARRAMVLSSLYREEKNLEKATAILQDWLSAHPNDAVVNTNLAMMLQARGLKKQAIKAYEQAYQANKNNVVVLNNLAWLYFEMGDPRAIEFSRQAYESMPERPEVVDTYGWILLSSGDPKRALVILQQAMVSAPNNPEIGYHVAVAMENVGRHEEARKLLRRLLKGDPRFEGVDKARALLDRLGG